MSTKQNIIEIAAIINNTREMDAKTAWAQIPLMTKMACGARDGVSAPKYLAFTVGGGARCRKVIITLSASDTYNVYLVRTKRVTGELIAMGELSDVYAEDLGRCVYDLVHSDGK
jgi:hypothetical protein